MWRSMNVMSHVPPYCTVPAVMDSFAVHYEIGMSHQDSLWCHLAKKLKHRNATLTLHFRKGESVTVCLHVVYSCKTIERWVKYLKVGPIRNRIYTIEKNWTELNFIRYITVQWDIVQNMRYKNTMSYTVGLFLLNVCDCRLESHIQKKY